MTDIILGMGEVGETLFDLLVDRKFDCIGIDLEAVSYTHLTLPTKA